MQIEYCEGCSNKLTDTEFNSGQAVWINKLPYCKSCGEKVQAAAPASRSGPRRAAGSGITRATPSGSRSTPGHTSRRVTTPSGSTPRRSGLNRAATESGKSSGGHTRRSSPRAQDVSEGPSMVMVSVIGAAIGVLLAVIVIMVFLR